MSTELKEWALKARSEAEKIGRKEEDHTYFFRSPSRPRYVDPEYLFSPADGIIIYQKIIKKMTDRILEVKGSMFTLPELMQDKGWDTPCMVIGIFMCYDESTEVYTSEGWKFFKDIRRDELILTRKPDGTTEWSKIKTYYKKFYDSEMYRINCKGIDLFVTPDHRIPILTDYVKDRYKFVPIKNIEKWSFGKAAKYTIPKQFIWGGTNRKNIRIPPVVIDNYKKERDIGDIPTDAWVKFLGWFLTEGNVKTGNKIYRITISQSLKHKEEIKIIENILKELPFKWYSYIQRGIRIFVIDNKQLCGYLKQFGKSSEKFIPQEIKSLDIDYLKLLFESMILGDGHRSKDGKVIQYITISRKLALDVQEIAYKCGYNAEIYKRKSNGVKGGIVNGVQIISRHDNYVVCVGVRRQKRLSTMLKHMKKENYLGYIYDIEVEKNHVIWIRRNISCIWSSNSEFDVHWNRVPYSGNLKYKKLDPISTSNIPMLATQTDLMEGLINKSAVSYLKNNERMRNRFYSPSLGQFYYVIQIADEDVDVIMLMNQNQNVFYSQNQQFSLVRYGSQTDLVVPLSNKWSFEFVQKELVHVEAGIDKLIKINGKA